MANLASYIRTPRGIVVNPVKERVRAYHVVSNPVTSVLTAAGTAGATQEVSFLIDSWGHFDWQYIVGTQTSEYFVDFFDPNRGPKKNLGNKPVSSANIVGTGQRPFRLPEPYFFNIGDGQRVLVATLRNLLSDSSITVRLALYGRKFFHQNAPPEVSRRLFDAFGGLRNEERAYTYFLSPREYAGDGTPVTVGALGTTTFTFESDSDYDSDLHKLMVSAQGAFSFTLRESSTDRVLANDVFLGTLGWGTAQFPFYFADTLLFERGRQLIMDITDLSGSTNRIAATIAGRVLRYER